MAITARTRSRYYAPSRTSLRPWIEQTPSNENQVGENLMDYRYLGRSGFRVPALSLGTATFGGKGAFFAAWGNTQAEQATRLVDMCLDFGLNMFDSADIYSAVLAEEIFGAAVKGKRDRVIISTKALSALETAPMTWVLRAII